MQETSRYNDRCQRPLEKALGGQRSPVTQSRFGFILKLFDRLLKLLSADRKDPALSDHRKRDSRKREELTQRLQRVSQGVWEHSRQAPGGGMRAVSETGPRRGLDSPTDRPHGSEQPGEGFRHQSGTI